MTATDIHNHPITDSSAWTRAVIEADNDWVQILTDAEIDDLDRALQGVRGQDGKLSDISQSDFPLPVLGPRLAALEAAVRVGRGFSLLRGIPVARYDDNDLFLMKWGIGTHLGQAISQNVYGDMLGHVFDCWRHEDLERSGVRRDGQRVELLVPPRHHTKSHRVATCNPDTPQGGGAGLYRQNHE
ncbi:MAG: hypothetical protein ACKVG6_18065 [Alphaproteobacteria bacterium]